jgi:hypothetical protein
MTLLLVLVVALEGNVSGPTAGLRAGAGNSDSFGTDGTGPTSDDVAGGGSGGPASGTPVTGGRSAGPNGSATPGAASSTSAKCRDDGRQPGFSIAMPPCVAVFTGDNGGATARGVTRDKILVVRYMVQTDAATGAALGAIGQTDDRAKIDRADATLLRYSNLHYETYGREVVLQTMEATGPSTDDAAMRADAAHIATELKAFAVLGYTTPPAFAEELAARGVPCIMCAEGQSRNFYKKTGPYVFARFPTLEEYYANGAEYIGKRLAGKPAKWAGELPAGMRTSTRKFGLIYPEKENAKAGVDFFRAELAKYGVTLTEAVGYTPNVSTAQEQATNLIVQLKDKGVSSIFLMSDFLYPVFFTREATHQRYFPEWIISGSELTDTTFVGRLFDQQQWRHAFGVAAQAVYWDNPEQSAAFKEYRHILPNSGPNDPGVTIHGRRWGPEILFRGIQMAGPQLTPTTFAQGLFAFPAAGGNPTSPLIAHTLLNPNAQKDFTEVFWDPTVTGPDETGQNALGVLLKVDGGRRYQLGSWPRSDPNVFSRAGTVAVGDNPPHASPHGADGHTHPPDQRCRSCGARSTR